MSGNTQPHSLPFLPKQPQQPSNSTPEAHLPQGECTFLKPQAGRTPLRCDCVAFTLDKDKPGTICGCGHQAWTHVRNHVGDGVSREEYTHLATQVKELRGAAKQLHDELTRQREQRDKDNNQIVDEFRKLFNTIAKVKTMNEHRNVTAQASLEQRITQVASHATHLEDRIEAVVDKTQNWDQIVEKINILDEASMRLEESVGGEGPERGSMSTRKVQTLPPVQETNSTVGTPMPIDQQPTALAQPTVSWTIKVVLLPKRSQRYAFAMDSVGWRRSYSRGLHQEVVANTKSAEDFVRAVDAKFKIILQNRPWAPFVCLRSENKELSQLPLGQDQPHLWDYAFLEKHCFAQDKLDGDVVYIAPSQDELPWAFIRTLPPVAGADETCWEHNNELDGFTSLNFSRPQTRTPMPPSRSPFRPQNNTLPPIDAYIKGDTGNSFFRKSSIETDSSSMYENSPPPYTTRTYNPNGMDGQIVDSRLNILAITALEREGTGRPVQSNTRPTGHHIFDQRASLPRPSTSAGPGERPPAVPPSMPPPLPPSTGNEMDIDDNADSRSERSGFDSHSLSRSASGSTSHSAPAPPPQQQFYFSGRSKRKIATGKYKEPVGISIGDVKLPRLGFHKHNSSDPDRNKGHGESSSGTGAA